MTQERNRVIVTMNQIIFLNFKMQTTLQKIVDVCSHLDSIFTASHYPNQEIISISNVLDVTNISVNTFTTSIFLMMILVSSSTRIQ